MDAGRPAIIRVSLAMMGFLTHGRLPVLQNESSGWYRVPA